MAASVTVDWLPGGYSFREDTGAAAEFTRTCFVTGLTDGSGTPLAARIAQARTALDTDFEYNDTTSADSNLRVVSRVFEPVDQETTKMKCTVTYAHRKDVLGPVGTWTPILSASINQVQTAKYLNGFPIVTQHTFENDDPNWHGETVQQGGQVAQFRPLVEITYRGLIQPASIFNEMIKYQGKLNSTTWNYGNPGRWLCANFTAELHDVSTTPDTWLAEVTFQADGFEWSQEAVFTDPATGKPPADLVPGVGIVRVQTQQRVDFNALIPAG